MSSNKTSYNKLLHKLLTCRTYTLSELFVDFLKFYGEYNHSTDSKFDDKIAVAKNICDRIYQDIYYLYEMQTRKTPYDSNGYISDYLNDTQLVVILSTLIKEIEKTFSLMVRIPHTCHHGKDVMTFDSYLIQLAACKTLFRIKTDEVKPKPQPKEDPSYLSLSNIKIEDKSFLSPDSAEFKKIFPRTKMIGKTEVCSSASVDESFLNHFYQNVRAYDKSFDKSFDLFSKKSTKSKLSSKEKKLIEKAASKAAMQNIKANELKNILSEKLTNSLEKSKQIEDAKANLNSSLIELDNMLKNKEFRMMVEAYDQKAYFGYNLRIMFENADMDSNLYLSNV